ncbi:MAG: hypothetical protein WKF57_22660 [Nakamurella sp.]
MALPNPLDAVRLASTAYGAVEQAIKLIPRVTSLLTDVERLVLRVGNLIGEVEVTQRRAAAAVTQVESVVAGAAGTQSRVATLVDRFEPVLTQLLPVLETLSRTTSAEEVAALVKLVDALPPIVDRLDTDIMPILDTLATVAPDLRDLLDVSRELNEIIGSVPGLRGIKRRVEDKQTEQDAHRADQEPPAGTQPTRPEATPS